MTPKEDNHIVVSAPPGGLARQLSLLLRHALHDSITAPDWAAPFHQDFDDQRAILSAQSILDAGQLMGLDAADGVQCKYTSLSVDSIREQHSYCKIISIVCTRQDYLQMAWNHVIEDSFKSMGQVYVDDYFANFIKNAHNLTDLDFVEILRDPQSYTDPRVTLYLNLLSRGHKRFPYEISLIDYNTTEPESDHLLKIDFANLCKPESGDTQPTIAKVIDFLGDDAVRSAETANASWNRLMKRLSQMQKTN